MPSCVYRACLVPAQCPLLQLQTHLWIEQIYNFTPLTKITWDRWKRGNMAQRAHQMFMKNRNQNVSSWVMGETDVFANRIRARNACALRSIALYTRCLFFFGRIGVWLQLKIVQEQKIIAAAVLAVMSASFAFRVVRPAYNHVFSSLTSHTRLAHISSSGLCFLP